MSKGDMCPCPPFFLSAVSVAEWRSGGLARRSSGGPAHQVFKNEDPFVLEGETMPT